MSTQGYSSYPNGFTIGMTLKHLPIQASYPGQIFWVNNSTVPPVGGITGSNGNPGTYSKPFGTVLYAISKCVANRGDVILVGAGHAETISSAAILTLTKAGVAIIGLGSGSLRPTFTFTTAATANIPLTAANVALKNLLFVANFADITSAITVTGTALAPGFILEDCEFRDTSSVLNFVKCVTGNATANCLAGCYIGNNEVFGLATTAATQMCIMASAQTRQVYEGNYCVYPALNDTAALVDFGANNQTNLLMKDNRVVRPSTSTTGGSLFAGGSTASTGYVIGNYSWHLDNTAGLLAPTGTALGFQENNCMITGAADKQGLPNPVEV